MHKCYNTHMLQTLCSETAICRFGSAGKIRDWG